MINEIHTSSHVSRVQGNSQGIVGEYWSKTMKRTIRFESTVELPLINKLERDSKVFECYSQPSTLVLECRSASGRKLCSSHTPDYFRDAS
jgi:hypothetical protein